MPAQPDVALSRYLPFKTLRAVAQSHLCRVYDPQLGRFLSADFVIPNGEHTESYNRYSYVFNNPLSLTDPDGQCPFCAIIVAVIGAAATYGATGYAAIVITGFFGMMAAAVASEGDPKAMLQGAVSGALFAWIGGAR